MVPLIMRCILHQALSIFILKLIVFKQMLVVVISFLLLFIKEVIEFMKSSTLCLAIDQMLRLVSHHLSLELQRDCHLLELKTMY